MLSPALSIEKYDRPPIPLVDPDTGEKIKLRLRRMSFAREISSLSSDMLELHELIIVGRKSRNESVYMIVAAWNKIRSYEKYWQSFNFTSEPEYLAYYGLPDGTTLAGWTVMVNLFDKPTFVLLGEQVLAFMMRLIGYYEKDFDNRKRAYQAVFDSYCSINDSFDKNSFFDILRQFVRKNYEESLAQRQGTTVEQFRARRNASVKRNKPATHKSRLIVKTNGKQNFGPYISQDFDWKDESCPYCLPKVEIIKVCKDYINKLEKMVRSVDPKLLPTRPAEIEDL